MIGSVAFVFELEGKFVKELNAHMLYKFKY